MKARKWMTHVGVVLGIVVFGFVPTSLSQECPQYVDTMWVNRWSSSPSQIEVSGSYVFVANDESVTIVDIADPTGPRVVGDVAGADWKNMFDISVSGHRLFVLVMNCLTSNLWAGCRGAYTLQIIDVSDPRHPEQLLTDYLTLFGKIVVTGNTVFLARTDGLVVFDVSDPSNPVEVGFLTSPWEPSGLVVEGALAYVALPGLGLKIIDVSDRTNPVEVGFWSADWNAFDLDVSNSFAYVADGDGGLRVIDASIPTDPTEVGALDTGHSAVGVSVDGSLAAVGLADEGIAIVDLTDKRDPVIVGHYLSEEEALDVDLVGSTAFALADGFRVLDLSFPDSPTELSSFSFVSSTMDVEISDRVMYVATGDSGLYVRDESNPEGVVESFLDTPGYALGVTLHDHLALVADGAKGVRIIDVSNTEDLAEVGFVDTPGEARRIAVAGDYAYVADGESGLRIIDISTPEEPIEVGWEYTPDPAVDVAVGGHFAYVADGNLRIIDISDPAQPIAVPRIAIPAFALAITDDVLYVAGPSLSLFSLANPEYLQQLASGMPFPWSREPTEISVSGDLAYVTTRWLDPNGKGAGRAWLWHAGVEVFEIDSRRFPIWVGRWDVHFPAFWAAAVSDGRIYLASAYPEIVVLDNRCLTTYWLEIATHENGFSGSRWRSDVFVSHESDSSVDFDFVLHTADGEFTAAASVDAGHQGVFGDVVDLLGYRGTGALEIRASNPLTVTSRVYSESDSGTYGSFLQAHRSFDCTGSGRLYGLRQMEGEFRTNISVTNTTDQVHEVWITLHRTDGKELIRYPVEVEPGVVVQELQPFKRRAGQPNLGWGYATVEGEQGILACASVIDSRTSDAVMVPLLQ